MDLTALKKIPSDKSYALGFAFDETLRHVVLLQKAKPEWAAGMWNGLGGKVEHGETPLQAMEREFEEECGVLIPQDNWLTLGAFQRPGWFVQCFVARTNAIFQASTVEAEKITIYPVHEFMANTILEEETHSGLECAWLVPYARRFLLHPDRHNEFTSAPAAWPEPDVRPMKQPRP